MKSIFKAMATNYNVRRLFTNRRVITLDKISPSQSSQNRADFLSKLLGADTVLTSDLLKKIPRLKAIEESRLRKSFKTLEHYKLTSYNILQYPKVLTISAGLIEQRYLCLSELGFIDIMVSDIVRFSSIMDSSPSDPYSTSRLPVNAVPFDNITSLLPAEIRPLVEEKRQELLNVTYKEMRTIILGQYLQWRLQMPVEVVQQMMKTYSVINYSFTSIAGTWDALIGDVQLEPKKIKNNFFLFQVSPKNIKAFLTELPTLGSLKIRGLIGKWPRILTTNPENLRNIYKLLTDHGLSDIQLENYPRVFMYSPTTLEYRLTTLFTTPEFRALKDCVNVLRLIYNQEVALARLDCLRKAGFTNLSVHMLTTSEDRFNQLLRAENPRYAGGEIVAFLSKTLDYSKETIFNVLRQNPKWSQGTTINANEVLNTLRKHCFSRQQILNGVSIVLYPNSAVASVLETLPQAPEAQPYSDWKNHYNVLQLVLFLLEKENNFCVDSVFRQP